MRFCTLITDDGLAHLTGIHTLVMHECYGITDAGLAHLTSSHATLPRPASATPHPPFRPYLPNSRRGRRGSDEVWHAQRKAGLRNDDL